MARLRLETEGAREMIKGQTLMGLECHTTVQQGHRQTVAAFLFIGEFSTQG